MAPWKRSMSKTSRSAFSTTWNAIPMSGVTHWKKDQSFWMDFCIPSYAVCGCRRAIPANVATNPTRLPPSPPDSGPAPPWSPWIPKGSGCPSLYEVYRPRRRPPSAGSYGETQLRCSWLSPGSSPTGALSSSGHQGVDGSPQRCRLPQRHTHTRSGWHRGELAAIHW